jgi:hypothetical protein
VIKDLVSFEKERFGDWESCVLSGNTCLLFGSVWFDFDFDFDFDMMLLSLALPIYLYLKLSSFFDGLPKSIVS